jgi:hypothetical protein
MKDPLLPILDKALGFKGLTTCTSVLLTALFGLAAWWILPDRPAVVTQTFQLSIVTETGLNTLTLKMSQVSGDHYGLQVALDPPASRLTLIMRFEPGVLPICEAAHDSAWMCTLGTWPFGYTLSLTSSGTGSGSIDVPISASAFTFGSNGSTAEAWLPNVSCGPYPYTSMNCAEFPAFVVSTEYIFPNFQSYNWNGGVPPAVLSGVGVWQRTPPQLSDPVLVSGTNPSAQQDDNFAIFLAGAAAGVAGGMLGLAVQAGIDWLATWRKSKSNAQNQLF